MKPYVWTAWTRCLKTKSTMGAHPPSRLSSGARHLKHYPDSETTALGFVSSSTTAPSLSPLNQTTYDYTHRPNAAAPDHRAWRRERAGVLRSRYQAAFREGSLEVCNWARTKRRGQLMSDGKRRTAEQGKRSGTAGFGDLWVSRIHGC